MTSLIEALREAYDATWPAAHKFEAGAWHLRRGAGGGKRVCAASLRPAQTYFSIAQAEQAMAEMGQRALFRIGPDDEELDVQLARRGYEALDETVLRVGKTAGLLRPDIPPITAFTLWEPLHIMREIWAEGGIGSARLQVMERAVQKTGILLRWNDMPAGVGFAALHENICMVHALHVREPLRRQGVASWIMRKAAHWAAAYGAGYMAVLVTRANMRANALYSTLGLQPVDHYHYRQHPKEI